MKWTNEYLLGIEEVDSDHSKLLQFISNIESAIDLNVESPMIHFAILELKNFANEHFESEEAMMRAHRYIQTEKHEIAHKHFIKKLEEIDHQTLNELTGRKQLLRYLRDWFVSHLNGPDRDYAEFVIHFGPQSN